MNREISVNLADSTGWNKEFNGSRDLLSFLENEFTYWEKQWKSLEEQGKKQHHYIGIYSHIGNAIFKFADLAMEEQTFEDYKSKYLDLVVC